MIKIKRGVKMQGLKEPMIKPLSFLDGLFQLMSVDFVVTDAVSERENKSGHPLGLAFDFRTRALTFPQRAVVEVLLNRYLGNDYDVIQYDTHIHIEYQVYFDSLRRAQLMSHFGQDKFTEVA